MATNVKTPNSECMWYADGNKIAILVKNENGIHILEQHK